MARSQKPEIAIQLAFIKISAKTPNLTAFLTSNGFNDFNALNKGIEIIEENKSININAK